MRDRMQRRGDGVGGRLVGVFRQGIVCVRQRRDCAGGECAPGSFGSLPRRHRRGQCDDMFAGQRPTRRRWSGDGCRAVRVRCTIPRYADMLDRNLQMVLSSRALGTGVCVNHGSIFAVRVLLPGTISSWCPACARGRTGTGAREHHRTPTCPFGACTIVLRRRFRP